MFVHLFIVAVCLVPRRNFNPIWIRSPLWYAIRKCNFILHSMQQPSRCLWVCECVCVFFMQCSSHRKRTLCIFRIYYLVKPSTLYTHVSLVIGTLLFKFCLYNKLCSVHDTKECDIGIDLVVYENNCLLILIEKILV